MNFLDAVRDLKEGRCERIKIGESEYILTPSGIMNIETVNLGIRLHPKTFLSEDWELVNPKPQFEEVEVKVLYSPSVGQIFSSATQIPTDCIELTGTTKREIKPKVKHRKEIGEFDKDGCLLSSVLLGIPNAKLIAEWEE